MAFIPAINVAEVVLGGVVYGNDVFTVHNFLAPSAWDALALQDLCVTVQESWYAELAPLLSVAYQLTFVRATDLTTSSAPAIEFFPNTNRDGGRSEEPLSNNAALVVSWQTALRGKSYRGRTYQGGLPRSAASTAVLVTGTYQTELTAGMIQFTDDIEVAAGVTHVIVSRQTGNAPRTTAVATPVTTLSVNRAIDSMRSRLEGRGN